jgi:hypothetical protein
MFQKYIQLPPASILRVEVQAWQASIKRISNLTTPFRELLEEKVANSV